MTTWNRPRGLGRAMLGVALLLGACVAPRDENTIAEYDGGTITRQQFETYLESRDTRSLRTDAAVPAEEGMGELLREYAATRILAAEGIEPEPVREPALFVSPEARFLVQYYRQRTGKRTHQVADEEARAFYDEHLESRFTLPERVRFQHVFLRRDRHDPGELASLEQRIVAMLRGGAAFEELVATYSESGSKATAGIVGPVHRGRLEPSFEDQLFTLPAGDRPVVIRTDLGSHVVVVLERNDSRILPFEDVKSQIAAGIIERRNEAERNEFFRTLRERFGVMDRSDEEGLADDEVVLGVHDRTMTRAEFEEYLERGAPFGSAHHGSSPQVRRTLVDDLIHFNLMYLDALEQGLDQEPNFRDRWQLNQMRMLAATAVEQHIERWTASLDDEEVLAYYQKHETRFAFPRRFDISYIYLPFGEHPPFEVQLRIEQLKRVAVTEGFDSATLAQRCAGEGAVCVNAGLISPRDAARVGPKFQRALLAMDEPGVSEPIKEANGLYVVAVHGTEDRRPMAPPDDMARIRVRYVQLEQKRIMASIKQRLLEESGFRVVAPLASAPGAAPGG